MFKIQPRMTKVSFHNVPDVLQTQAKNYKKLVRENKISELQISKNKDSKFLPKNDAYFIYAQKNGKDFRLSATSVIIEKSADVKTSLKEINDAVTKTIDRLATPKAPKNEFFKKVFSFLNFNK